MDQERILAARKRLKEFQKKKYESSKNVKEGSDLHDNDRRSSAGSSKETLQNAIQTIQQNLELKQSNESIQSDVQNTTQSPSPNNDADYMKSFTPSDMQQNTNIQNICQDYQSINGSTEIPSYNNFTPAHSRNESTSTVSSQIIHDNADKDHFQLVENSNLGLNASNNSPGSLQKEHLLQMANAVANVLVDEPGLDESTLNHCDLEQRNQFLTCCLEEQKKLVNQLHIQVSQSNSRISELEAIITAKDTEFENRIIREINPLKEQIQLDAQTIGILVGEKAELTATNTQCQATIKQKTEEMMELSGKLKVSEQRITELERELEAVKNNIDGYSKSYQQSQNNYEEVVEKLAKLKKENEDSELEISELRQKLNYKNTELSNLQQELQEKVALLALSELRVQQLMGSPQEMNSLESQHHATKALEHQISQMKVALESVSGEKDEVSKKYQSYIQQLDERYTKVVAELEAAKKIINDSEAREHSYIQRLSDLEQQLQREKDKTIKPIEDQSEKIEMLTKSMDNLVLEQENLQSLLNEKDNEIEALKKELQEFQEVREQSLEATKLAKALQSEQLGASRAVSQNHQLKIQLEEMNDAFTSLIDTKLDLTEKLQAERSIGKKLNAQLNEMEQEIEQLKKHLSHKEALLMELEKEKLHTAQIEDQIQHYQAQSHNATTLQEELQKALLTIENLKRENQLLYSKIEKLENNNVTSTKKSQETSESELENSAEDKSLITEEKSSENVKENETLLTNNENSIDEQILNTQSVISNNSTIPSISDPIKKLENRFKETMEKVAELTDEKQRLEHLVLQLQGETETIGEYVTLYQRQRAILKQRAKEKENNFRQILEQRNQQQEQLHKLKVLVAELLKSKSSASTVSTAAAAEKSIPPTSHSSDSEINNVEVVDGSVNKPNEVTLETDETTSQILDLLTEIKDCNACTLEPNFHPCPWCSGKLITV